MTDRFLSAIYCDDIREEIGGKRTLVGIYGDALIVPQTPGLIPKLGIIVTLYSDRSNPVSRCKIVVRNNDQDIGEMDLDAAELANVRSQLDAPETSKWERLEVAMLFSPVHISQPGAITVQAITESETLQALPLSIRTGPILESVSAR